MSSSDLDARVAALMDKADRFADERGESKRPVDSHIYRNYLEQAIRAELQKPTNFLKERAKLDAEWVELAAMKRLQKPALHEPVTWKEAEKTFAVYCGEAKDVVTAMRNAIESFLQGRAKIPAITANFEVVCEDKWIGSTDAPVKRVEVQDDGSLIVVIDYWPPVEAECQHKVFSHFGDQKLRRCVNCGIQEPAQEEITDAERYKYLKMSSTCSEQMQIMLRTPWGQWDTTLDEFIRASKGEKT